MPKISLAIASVLILAAGVSQFVQAAGATLYLAPASGSVQQGSNLVVAVHVNTGGDTVNAVQANLSYPTDKLDFVSIASSSAFPFEVESSGGSGSVHIARGNASGVTGDQVVASVTFTAKNTTGTAAVSFASGSSVIRSSDSTDILSGTTGGSYTITAPSTSPSPTPSPSPSPSSSSSSSSSSSKKTTGSSTSTTPSPSPSPAVAGDKIAPTISDVKVVDIAYKSATITWVTSEPASSTVNYGITAGYGLTAIDGSYVTNHRVALPPDVLAAGTQFNFMVKSVDPAGNTVTSDNGTFTTKGMTLQVTVVGQSGKAVKGAKVTIGSKSATSDKLGHATLTDLPAGKQKIKVEYVGKTVNATVDILDNGNSKLQTTTVKVTAGGLPLYILVPIIVVAMLALAAAAMFAIRFIRSRRGNGGGHVGPAAPGPVGPPTTPMDNVSSLPPATVVRPTEINGPTQQPQ